MTRRRRQRLARRAVAAAVGLAVSAWAWQTHPHAAAATSAAVAAATLTLAAPRVRSWARMWLRPTVVYRHRFRCDLPRPVPAGRIAYIGITNNPRIRAEQHAASSWWFPLTDPRGYTHKQYRTRLHAAAVETWAIRLHTPVGNIRHNRRYAQQTRLRAALLAAAGQPEPRTAPHPAALPLPLPA